jgi:hypothetical protein
MKDKAFFKYKYRWVQLQAELPLLPAEFHELSNAVGYYLRDNELPFGICRYCQQKHTSVALKGWMPVDIAWPNEDSGNLGISYKCPNISCKGNELIEHYASSYIVERVDRCVWEVLIKRQLPDEYLQLLD